jgi:hypothetical protein
MQQIIPLPNPPQPNLTQTLTLSVDGSPLTLMRVLRYNEIAGYWCETLSDSAGNLLLDSVPLLTGNGPACNILRQYSYLQIGSEYILNVSGSETPNYPNNQNLGSGYLDIWGDTP